MHVLGIDPGIGRMGWGIIQAQNSKVKAQNYGCIETEVTLHLEERLLIIYQRLVEIITEYKPDVVAIEELFFGTNAKTALVVGQARGVALLVAAEKKLPIHTYTPLQVKIALTGYGRAEKKQVGQMVKTILKLTSIPKPDDTADAVAIALTHAFSCKVSVL